MRDCECSPRYLSLARNVVLSVTCSLLAPSALFASSVILRSERGSQAQPASVGVDGATRDVVSAPVKPDTTLTILWIPQSSGAAVDDQGRGTLLALYAQMHGRPVHLAVLHGAVVEALGTISSRAQLEQKLAGAGPQDAALPGPALVDAVVANAAQLGSKWSPVVIVGAMPKLDPAVETYAHALLEKAFTTQQLRVSLLSDNPADSAWAALFAASGGAVLSDPAALPPILAEARQDFQQVTWTDMDPPAGFVVSSATVVDAQGTTLATATDLASLTETLPTLEQYAAMQIRMAGAFELVQASLTDATRQQVREAIAAAQVINPVEPIVLQTQAAFGEQINDPPYAVKAATMLTVVRPVDGGSFVTLAHALLFAGEFAKAEKALDNAATLGVPKPQLAELYARAHLGGKDERGALPYLEQALAADSQRQDLWFLQARTADHLHESVLAIHSFELGLALGGVHIVETASLLHLYVASGDGAKARAFALRSIQSLPPDVEVRSQLSEAIDRENLAPESLAAWKSVLTVRPDVEHAQVRVAELLLATGDAKASEEASEAGLEILPKSGGLYIAKAAALSRQGRAYDARNTLEAGAANTDDVALLTQLAVTQDAYGDRGAEAYLRLASALANGSPARTTALERGFSTALRDGDLKRASVLAGELDAAARPQFRTLLGEKRQAQGDTVIPGGVEALAFVARMRSGIPPETFFADFAVQVVQNVCGNCPGDHFSGAIQSYFATIAELESLGKRDGSHVTLHLSVTGKDDQKRTQNILRLLGIKMHTEKGQLRLDRGEKQSQEKKQDVLAALAIDEVGLQDALQAGKPFEFEIDDEAIPVYPSAAMWKEAFPRTDQAQFPLMLVHNPAMARLYVGISGMDRPTVKALIGTGSLFFLAGHPADLLLLYGAAFAVEGERASVPGGAAAIPVWSKMVGASPEQASLFFQAMLQQKNPSLLAYFYALSHLDPRHQAFFTANAERTRRFYDLFSSLPESQSLSGTVHDSSFTELLSSLPIDDEGHVAFPGSPEVWTIVKGKSADDKHVAKLLKKVSRAASPDVEDEVLLHLASTRYKAHQVSSTELDNFLAVARIDAHRASPLDEESALMLAQHYSEYSPVYPYFADLPAIDAAGFHSFFNAAEAIRKLSPVERQLELGQFYALIEWVVLLERNKTFDDAHSAHLFSAICDRFAAANDESAVTVAALDLAQQILFQCGQGTETNWDTAVRACLLGNETGGSSRTKDFQVVLDEQKAPSLESLRVAATTVRAALPSSHAASRLEAIGPSASAFPSVLPPKEAKVNGKPKEFLLLYDPAPLQKRIDEWNQNVAKPKQNVKSGEKLAAEVLKAMEPQLTLALTAPVYAYFFRSSDLVISEDPLLLRKHRYFDFVSPVDQHQAVTESAFISISEGAGSYLQGSFAQIALESGFAASTGWKQGGSGGNAVIAEQIAAIRSSDWKRLVESDQRLVALRILAAREWIVASAQDPSLLIALSEETSGLLSLPRRAMLLSGIEDRDWKQVWQSITLPDLFRLGGEYLKHAPGGDASSPVVAQLRSVSLANNGDRLNVFGRIPNHVLGCSHTHLVADAPYEEYERQLLATFMAERTAEFKLFLAYRADSLGVPPSALSSAAEPLARKAFRASRMNDYRDWRSLINAYSSITGKDLEAALEHE